MSHKANTYYPTLARLLYNTLTFRFRKVLAVPGKPCVISLSLTRRCNSHCIMCNIWKKDRDVIGRKESELSYQEIMDLFSQPLFSDLVELDLTGGEPHLRNDLADIILGIARLKSTHLHRLRSIIVTSNGLLPERIISSYQKVLGIMPETGIDLVSVNSLDGFGETHDFIRGTPGAYQKVTRTIDGLRELQQKYPHFYAGIKTTILHHNVDSLDAILDFALAGDLFYIISPVFFTEARFENMEQREALALGLEDYQKIAQFYTREELKTGYFYSRARDILLQNRKSWICTAGYNYLFIEFDGKLYPCEMIGKMVGDLRKQDPETIWKSQALHNWRKRMGKMPSCRRCLEPGAIRYSAAYEGWSYLNYVLKLGKSEFSKSLDLEGYSKYLVA